MGNKNHFEDNGNTWLQESGSEPGVFLRFEKWEDGTFYHSETPKEVRSILSGEMHNHCDRRVRLFQGDRETGRDWCEENDVTGFIGRSMGPVKVPLLLPTHNSSGGGAILDHCILRILINGYQVYRAKNYQEPLFVIFNTVEETNYPFEVWVNGSCHAAFETEKKRQRWLDFMTGKRMTK